ncbi:hypothetical protein Gohar_000692 [Gossypium harknessii]|uniref:Uncharacterized protein n=1 Tax=Gossypium harknessii TaxID=34285 RepID=A0A7J9I1J7_9ROSI|nr:hypothetical protein [Gossypium harknessii]
MREGRCNTPEFGPRSTGP